MLNSPINKNACNMNNLQVYICKYCNKSFKCVDKKNKHELNIKCNSKKIYYKLTNIIHSLKKELECKDIELNNYKNNVNYLKSILYYNIPPIISTINNDNNINFNDIKNYLDKFNIYILSEPDALINFIMNIFFNKIKLTNECKQVISYYYNDKLINDIKCKIFLCNIANNLTDISDKICQDGKNDKTLNDTIIKKACLNNMLLFNISSEKGIKNSIRVKNKLSAIILVYEIIKYLKFYNLTKINSV